MHYPVSIPLVQADNWRFFWHSFDDKICVWSFEFRDYGKAFNNDCLYTCWSALRSLMLFSVKHIFLWSVCSYPHRVNACWIFPLWSVCSFTYRDLWKSSWYGWSETQQDPFSYNLVIFEHSGCQLLLGPVFDSVEPLLAVVCLAITWLLWKFPLPFISSKLFE